MRHLGIEELVKTQDEPTPPDLEDGGGPERYDRRTLA